VFDRKGVVRLARIGGEPDDAAALERAVAALVAER
jgi:hypothetical protein